MRTMWARAGIGGATLLLAVGLGGCSGRQSESQEGLRRETARGTETMTITISSPAFREGEAIPRKHTCEGEDISPALRWDGVPEQARSLALICEDPDAPRGTWIHWVLWGLPATERELTERTPRSEALPSGAKQGTNDFKVVGYRGPCPPPGGSHRYFFQLFALDTLPPAPERATAADLRRAMEGHIVAEGALVGRYQRGMK